MGLGDSSDCLHDILFTIHLCNKLNSTFIATLLLWVLASIQCQANKDTQWTHRTDSTP